MTDATTLAQLSLNTIARRFMQHREELITLIVMSQMAAPRSVETRTKHLITLERGLTRIMASIDHLTSAVDAAVSTMQHVADQLAQKARDDEDPEIEALAQRLQGATNALSTASTQHGAPSPGGTPAGANTPPAPQPGSQPTRDTVAGATAGNNTVIGEAARTEGASASSGTDTVTGAGANATVTGAGNNDTVIGTGGGTSRTR